MIPPKPYLLGYSAYYDQITVLNLCYPDKTFKVSKSWFKAVSDLNMLDDCQFNIIVSDKNFIPHAPTMV